MHYIIAPELENNEFEIREDYQCLEHPLRCPGFERKRNPGSVTSG